MSDGLKRRLAIGAFFLSLLVALPAALLTLLFLLSMVIPTHLMWVTQFRVRNESGEPVRFWVAGTGESGALGLLPLYETSDPTVRAVRNKGFHLDPGATTVVTYDWDDYNFTVILVKLRSGEVLAVDVDAEERAPGCCYRHGRDEYVLPPPSQFRVATPDEREVLEARDRSMWVILGPAIFLTVAPVYFYRLQRRLRVPRGGRTRG